MITPPPRRVRAGLRCAVALGLMTLSAACDEQIEVGNAQPSATIEGWCTAEGRTYLVVDIRDLESDPVDLAVCQPQGPALGTGPAGDGLFGLSSEPTGRRHLVEWAAGGECACPRSEDDPTTGSCVSPPGDGQMPSLEVLVGDPAHAYTSLGEQPVAPLGDCP